MTGTDQRAACRLYLVSPPAFDLDRFSDDLAGALEAGDVACFQLALDGDDDALWLSVCERLIPLVQARDVAFLLNGHVHLVAPTGADGSHVDGPIRGLRKKLPGDAILGAGCGLSRHDAMVAGEAGADYVAFGPWGPDAAEHLAWWQETMELPCVALGLPDPLSAQAAARSGADFVVLGDAVWDCERGAASAVSSLTAAIAKATSH